MNNMLLRYTHYLLVASFTLGCGAPNGNEKALALKLKEKELALKERQLVLDSLKNAGYKPESIHTTRVRETKKEVVKQKDKLEGRHKLSLQWISWEHFGYIDFIKTGENTYKVSGTQEGGKPEGQCDNCYLKIEGTITKINDKELSFTGSIVTSVYYIQEGEPCIKQGTFTFKATQGRKYWREQKMEGCDGVTNYVDIYF